MAVAAILMLCACVGAKKEAKTPQPKKENPASATFAPAHRGILAGKLGEGLSPADHTAVLDAQLQALDQGIIGAPVRWTSPSGLTGSVTPGPRYHIGDNICRRYIHTINFSEQTRRADGTACLIDGKAPWQMIES